MELERIAVRHDDCIAQAETPDKTAMLIRQWSGGGIEINKFSLRAGEAYTMSPPVTGVGLKIFTLLSGEFHCIDTKADYRAGSSFVLRPRHEMLNIIVSESGEMLVHAIGEESFHLSSEAFRKLHDTMMIIQAKDAYTYEHCRNVHRLVKRLVGKLGITGARVQDLLLAARYHDIGKILIDDRILNKPGGLDAAEFETMKAHATGGRDIILEFFNEATYRIISQHHERMDGSGYPLGLRGDAILEEARLLAVCDAYDAMVSDRVYKKGKSRDEAIAELRRLSGGHFDPRMVDLFIAEISEAGPHGDQAPAGDMPPRRGAQD